MYSTVPKGLPKNEAMQVPIPSEIIDSRTGNGSLFEREKRTVELLTEQSFVLETKK